MRALLALLMVVTAGCNTKVDPFKPKPECVGSTVVPFMGQRQLLISSLAIADFGEGFDLDLDGKKDNKLAPIGALANTEIANAFKQSYDIIIPFELFGYDGEANSTCTKVAFYIGQFVQDADMDGKSTKPDGGDCLDTDAAVKPGATEDLNNRLDDDCDGFADNMTRGSRPTDNADMDGDGFSLMQGDCDDRSDATNLALAKSRNPSAMDACADGIDQNCDGIPDNDATCNPFANNFATVDVAKNSFDASGAPLIAFRDGTVKSSILDAGPSLFSVNIPLGNRGGLDLQLTGSRLQMLLVDNFAFKQTSAKAGLLAGVLTGFTLAQITDIDAGGVIKKEQSLLDAIFVGPIATILGLDSDKDQHYVPDIDVDGDGIESFWMDTTVSPPKVDSCRDGDGTIVKSTADAPCALAKDKNGKYRFQDGLSVTLKFTAVPVNLSGQIIQ